MAPPSNRRRFDERIDRDEGDERLQPAEQPIHLAVEEHPDADELGALDDALTAFTVGATGHGDARPLAVVVRDERGVLTSGIHGWTWGRCCELVTLWVDERQRRRGLGRALLAAAEAEARRRGCRQVVLFTHGVQAPGLYLSSGYEVMGEVQDYPEGSSAFWFRKSLPPDLSDVGPDDRPHEQELRVAVTDSQTKDLPGVVGAGDERRHRLVEERSAEGRAARVAVPRASHAAWDPPSDRPDPVALLGEEDTDRVAELVPIRYARMVATPFAFFGAAVIMASDLATTPISGITVQLCGDAHLSNFGGFASPDRDLVFSINDFDETLPGPWEWDVKRLAASFAIAGRQQGFPRKERRTVVLAAVGQYRQAMREFAVMRNTDVWYARLDAAGMLERWGTEVDRKATQALTRAVRKARSKDSLKALAKLTQMVDGEPRIISDPPLLVPLEELNEYEANPLVEEMLLTYLRRYGQTLPPERRRLLESYRYVHFARKVVGVGSVGTRAWVVLLTGRDHGDPLFLQVKEAGPSVLSRYLGPSEFDNQGQRVVEGQRMIQSASDVFLGWLRTDGVDGIPRDFYVRQLWDWKISATIETMRPMGMGAYARTCGWTLARAHARSGDRIAIAEYLGSGPRFDEALADFAETYADQNEADHAALAEAVRTGRVSAVEEVR